MDARVLIHSALPSGLLRGLAKPSLAVAALTLTAGCMKDSKLYCEKHGAEDPATCGYLDASIDARPMCNADPDCTAPAARCELTSHYCVECLTNTDCTNSSQPFCDPDTYTCEGCVAHSDCPSSACLPTGICGEGTQVAFVDPAATATTGCSSSSPCGKIADALKTMRPYVKVKGAISEAVAINQNVTVLADPGTTLTRPNSGAVISVAAGNDVAVYDVLVIGNNDVGIANAASTLRLTRVAVTGCNAKNKPAVDAKGGTTILSRCQLYGNAGGGITTDATASFNVTNTFIVHNGAADSTVGGAKLGATSSGQNRFELNTVADNMTAFGTYAGVQCGPTNLTLPNNILSHNLSNNDTLNTYANNAPQGLGCAMGSSKTAIDSAPFKFVMDGGAGPWDYHIQAGSTAIDVGSMTDINFDIDGDLRPTTAVDVGADELK